MSVSRNQVWELCRLQYKYKYHLRLDSLEPEPFYFVYGKIVHKIAQEYIIRKGESTLAEIAKSVLAGEIPIEEANGNPVYAPPLWPDYRDRLGGHLGAIRRLTEKLGFDGYTEYNFKYDLDPPNEKFLVGFIDRLFQKGDNWYVIDYKTTKPGSYRKTAKTVVDDIQLRCYAKVVQRNFNVPAENIKTALYYLEGANLIGAQFTQASLDTVENDLKKAFLEIEAIQENDAWGNVGDHCTRCGWRKICPVYRAQKNQ